MLAGVWASNPRGVDLVTYAELKERYPTNALGSGWYDLSDDELEADRRVAAAFRAAGAGKPEARGGRRIEGWIAAELRARAHRYGAVA